MKKCQTKIKNTKIAFSLTDGVAGGGSLAGEGREGGGFALDENVLGGLPALQTTAFHHGDAQYELRQRYDKKIKGTENARLQEMSEHMGANDAGVLRLIRDEAKDAERERNTCAMIRNDHPAIGRHLAPGKEHEEEHRSDQRLQRAPADTEQHYQYAFQSGKKISHIFYFITFYCEWAIRNAHRSAI